MSSIDRGPSRPAVRDGGRVVIPPRHPEHAYIGPNGYRNLDMEVSVFERDDGAIVYSDTLDTGSVAVVLELNAEGVEWLLDELDGLRDDRFVRGLTYARDLAKVIAWDRAAGRLR
jgi:hypothetical protein